jgi:hypothetical protein
VFFVADQLHNVGVLEACPNGCPFSEFCILLAGDVFIVQSSSHHDGAIGMWCFWRGPQDIYHHGVPQRHDPQKQWQVFLNSPVTSMPGVPPINTVVWHHHASGNLNGAAWIVSSFLRALFCLNQLPFQGHDLLATSWGFPCFLQIKSPNLLACAHAGHKGHI